MKKRLIRLLIAVAIISIMPISFLCSAHPGRTDSDGGHYDRSTGKYHYHHGYPAHQHTNGECPYDFKDKTNHQSGHTSSSSSFKDIISTIFKSFVPSITISAVLWFLIWTIVSCLTKKELSDKAQMFILIFSFICSFIVTFYIIFTN